MFSCVQLFVTPWTAACQAPLSVGFSRQEYWSELPFPAPGDLPYPGIEPRSPALQVDSLPPEPPVKPNRSYLAWNSPGQNTGVGSRSFLQGICPTKGSNPGLLWLLHWQANSLPLCHLIIPEGLANIIPEALWSQNPF